MVRRIWKTREELAELYSAPKNWTFTITQVGIKEPYMTKNFYTLKVKVLNESATTPIPFRATDGSAGYDLAAGRTVTLAPGETLKVPTGVAVELPWHTAGFIKPRSSAYSKGLDMDGTIDADYRGELLLNVRNTTNGMVTINQGDRIGQLVLVDIYTPEVEIVDALGVTERGEQGFGSTGVGSK